MRLVTYSGKAGREVGLVKPGGIVPLEAALRSVGLGPVPGDMQSLIDAGPSAWRNAQRANESLDEAQVRSLALPGVKVHAPLPRPRRNVICVGRNYREHAAEQGASAPSVPVFFTKAVTTVVGPDDEVPYPPGVSELDYEGELALVIGLPGKDISAERALDHVFGFTIINDITARDVQHRHLQWFKGKSFDGTCPMGPELVTRGELGDLTQLRVRTFVNGDLRQDQRIGEMIFDVPTIIASLSAGMTLEPGDVIATGTPSGVGAPTRRFLQASDQIEVHVDGVGVLRSRIGPERPGVLAQNSSAATVFG